MAQEQEKKKRRVGLLVTLLVNLLIVAYIAIKEFGHGDRGGMRISVWDIKPHYLLYGAICLAVSAFADYRKYYVMLTTSESRFDRRGALECALLGKYYDYITPFGAGGQPFQIRYLAKRGYSAGTSAAAPMMGYITQQFAFIMVALFVFIGNSDVISGTPGMRVTAYIGLSFFSIIPLTLILFVIIPKPLKAFIKWLVRMLSKIRFGRHRVIKDADAVSEDWLCKIDESIKCIRVYAKHPFVFAMIMLYSLLYQAATLSIPYFTLRAFGGSVQWATVTSLVVYVYATMSIAPTPGHSGAAEGSFYLVFESLRGGMLFWAMIVWRLLVYYSWLIVGIVIIAGQTVTRRVEKPKPPRPEGPLRVALFTDRFFPSAHESVRCVDAYARNINRLGAYACVVHPRQKQPGDAPPYDAFATPSVFVKRLNRSLSTGFASKELKKAFKTDPPDVIHAHSPLFCGQLALRLGRKYHVPVIASFYTRDGARNRNSLYNELFSTLKLNFYIKAKYVWTNSRDNARILRRLGYHGEIFVFEGADTRLPADDPRWEELIQRVMTAYRTNSKQGYTDRLSGIFDEIAPLPAEDTTQQDNQKTEVSL